MRRNLLLLLLALLLVGSLVAYTQEYVPTKHPVNRDVNHRTPNMRPDPPEFSISLAPQTLITTYYDYMIGGYSSLPMKMIPDAAGGGYFISYHARRQVNGLRRAFAAYIQPDNEIGFNNEITSYSLAEGFVSMDVDPVSGKPMYAWHANMDTDAEYEVMYAWDIFLDGTPGIFTIPDTLINNPTPVPGNGTTDNEFIWPNVYIGPSPTPDMRRVYVTTTNRVTHSGTAATENVAIYYADFNQDMILNEIPLTWNTVPATIPTLDTWNITEDPWRRPYMTFVPGNDGSVYYIGYHVGTQGADDGPLYENTFDCFVNNNYGVGEWTRITANSIQMPSMQPTGFTDVDTLFMDVTNSGHFNAVFGNDGKIHYPLIYCVNDNLQQYYPAFHSVRSVAYDPVAQTFDIDDLYPKGATPNSDPPFTPWDVNEDGIEDTDPDGNVVYTVCWPFCHWDQTLHDNAMFFNYGFVHMTEPSEHGVMAAVWEDSQIAHDDEAHPAVPEIYISISPDNGYTWLDPIVMSSTLNTQLADQIPMWVYPANKIEETSVVGNTVDGRLFLFYLDDNSWGSYQQQPPAGQNDGGTVKYMAIDFTITANTDPVHPALPTMLAQNYPNPFNPRTGISFTLPKATTAKLSVYNAKGQLIRTLCDDALTAGKHDVSWDGMDKQGNRVPSGMYFYKLNAAGKTETRKMLLIK